MWHLKIPPKIRIFMWKACENALPTMQNLRKREVATDGVCPICGNEAKSICHALFKSNFAKNVWSRWKKCLIKICAENQDFVDVALGLFYARTNRDMEIMVVTTWAIWYNRNQCVHEGEKLVASMCRLLNGNFSVLEIELLAMEAGILLEKDLGFQQIIIESDSLLAAQSISTKIINGETGHIVQGMLCNLDCFGS